MITWVLVAGGVAGLGVLLLFLVIDQRPAAGAAALARLDLDRRRFRRETILSGEERTGESLNLRRIGASLRETLEARGIQLPSSLRADLSLVGQSIETFIATSVLAAVGGLVAPTLATVLYAFATGGGLGPIPFFVALVGALVGALLPYSRVRSAAEKKRRDFRHVVGSFLDLVAMNLSGGRGVPEALDGAAAISDSTEMVRIRSTLQTARLQGITPWAALGQLGEDVRIDELRDLAAALALVAEDGAKVRESLYARSESMRQRELADAEGRAQADSQSMLVAQLLLCVGFLVFLTYPALARVLESL